MLRCKVLIALVTTLPLLRGIFSPTPIIEPPAAKAKPAPALVKQSNQRLVCNSFKKMTYLCPVPVDEDGDKRIDKCLPKEPGGETDTAETVRQIVEANAVLKTFNCRLVGR
jgi:hypothetical protein